MKRNIIRTTTALASALCMGAYADLATYSQDFESLGQADPAALSADGWKIFANVFDSGGGYLYGYGVFDAPNGTGGFSEIAAGEGGVGQGAQQLNVFSDYNNGDHAVGNLIEANVFQEWTVGLADVGSTLTFNFDAKLANLESPTTALAFIKTLDPNAGFSVSNFVTQDTTAIPSTWDSYSIDLEIDAGLVGQILQVGFSNTASNYDGSGVFYDNVNVAIPEPTTIAFMGIFGGAMLFVRRLRIH